MLALLMSLALSACSPATAGSKPLSFELQGHRVIVPVVVSGVGPLRFLLDTGASRSVIGERLAARLGWRAMSATRMVTPAGKLVRATVPVALQLGELAAARVTATVLPQEELAALRGLDGIVGQDVLAPLAYTIDYQRQLLVWDPPPAPFAHRIRLEFDEGRPLITIPAQSGVPQGLHVIPDSGADGIVLFARRGVGLPFVMAGEVGLVRTVAGHHLAHRVILDPLSVGGVRLERQSGLVLSNGDALLGDGLLPLHLFSRVTFNGPGGYMLVSR
jgi:predicted aspartyl protease